MPCIFQINRESFWGKIKRKIFLLFKRKRSLENSEQIALANLQAILDATVDSIITIDEECIIKSLNQTTERMFGYSKEELLGKNINILMPEPYHHEHDSYVHHYLQTGQKKIIDIGREMVAKKKDGTVFPIDLAISEVVVENERLFTGIIRDISERKDSERIRLEGTRIETEMKAKRDFIMRISHELRTPLHAIMGFTEYLMNQIDGPLNEAQIKSLQSCHNSSKHLLELVSGVLELSKAATIELDVSKEKCNIVDILNSCLEIVQVLAYQRNIKLEKKIGTPVVHIAANPKYIQEIFLNLLSNAIKFTDKGSVICSLVIESDQAKITVEDSGIGIEAGDLTKIFMPFTRLSTEKDPLNKERPGVGLGLSITKQLVELYKGSISVASKKGRGSTFTVYLPLFKQEKSVTFGEL